jgi:hypothetical protein
MPHGQRFYAARLLAGETVWRLSAPVHSADQCPPRAPSVLIGGHPSARHVQAPHARSPAPSARSGCRTDFPHHGAAQELATHHGHHPAVADEEAHFWPREAVPVDHTRVEHDPSCFAFLRGAARPAGRGDSPGMARFVILEGEGESIDGLCATLMRVIRRCFPVPPYRARWSIY